MTTTLGTIQVERERRRGDRREALLRAALDALNHAAGFRFNAQGNPAGLKVDRLNCVRSYDLAAAIERELDGGDDAAR